ncbi:MAG: type II toxin-antitoxin system VapC family toxin [Hyphomonadaceae bacterium]|nr:type II toxin-antitoxin system VapC family toxin [Hyphomonadaceae bacterium]
MSYIVDASVALKWVILEEHSEAARQLLIHDALAAPELFWIECANVLWAKARRRQISVVDARDGFDAIEATPIATLPVRPLARAAQAIALELNQSAYDSLYLAAALAERCVLVTADEVFASAARAHPVYARSVRLLGTSV